MGGWLITTTFSNLQPEKRKAILDAALKEFSDNGYKQASTNTIVKNAEIGKGMLFYYFKSKKGMYEYLIDYSLDFIKTEYYGYIDESETDFIERYRKTSEQKLHCYLTHPYIFTFLGTLFLSDEKEWSPSLKEKYEELTKIGYSKMYHNVDMSLFREDVEVEKVFKLIAWALEGYGNDLKQRLQGQKISEINMEPYWNEFHDYLDILKKSFYKQEECGHDYSGNDGSDKDVRTG